MNKNKKPVKGINFAKSKDLVKEVFEILKLVFTDNYKADKAIETIMKKHRYRKNNERAFVSKLSYDLIRHWRLLWNVTGLEPSLSVFNLWKMYGSFVIWNEQEVPELFKTYNINPYQIEKNLVRAYKNRAVRESVPEWFDKLGVQEFGKQWDSILKGLNTPAPVILRTNILKTGTRELMDLLFEEGIETMSVKGVSQALELPYFRNVFRSDAFKRGLFEMQDAASQLVCLSLEVAPGMRVVDACAGTGGKSLHLACLMQNKGKIIALDNKEHKLADLKTRARRAGAAIIETRVIDSTKVIKRLENTADRILLDVPCSGTGIIRRNPDIKWRLTPEKIENLHLIQWEILSKYSSMLKPGGKMVYSTCSILPSEGERQVERFLKENPTQYKLISEKRTFPHLDGFDGFYIAVIEKLQVVKA